MVLNHVEEFHPDASSSTPSSSTTSTAGNNSGDLFSMMTTREVFIVPL